MLAQRPDELHVVLDDDDRPALAGDAPQPLLQLLGLPRVEAGGRLVEQQHVRPPEQRARDFDLLLHAVGKVVHFAAGELRQSGPFQRVHRLPRPAGAPDGAHGIQDVGQLEDAGRLPDQDVLQNGEVRNEPDVLEAPRHPAAHPQAGRHAGQVLPVDVDPSGRDRVDAADQVEDGGLARAVGSDEGGALAARHVERQIPDDLQPAEGLGHPVQAQDRRVSHGIVPPPRRRRTGARRRAAPRR